MAVRTRLLYQAEVSLVGGRGRLVDCVTQPLGLRYYRIDPDKGFFSEWQASASSRCLPASGQE